MHLCPPTRRAYHNRLSNSDPCMSCTRLESARTSELIFQGISAVLNGVLLLIVVFVFARSSGMSFQVPCQLELGTSSNQMR